MRQRNLIGIAAVSLVVFFYSYELIAAGALNESKKLYFEFKPCMAQIYVGSHEDGDDWLQAKVSLSVKNTQAEKRSMITDVLDSSGAVIGSGRTSILEPNQSYSEVVFLSTQKFSKVEKARDNYPGIVSLKMEFEKKFSKKLYCGFR